MSISEDFLQVGIINIGDEIVIGQVNNTNAGFIAQHVNALGTHIRKIVMVGDEGERIFQALDDMLAQCEVVFITGGLGTTKDDITKGCLCRYFGRVLEENQSVLKRIQAMLRSPGVKVPDSVLEQAMLLQGSEDIPNMVGFAPGIWIEQKEKIVVSMPGVPQEMQSMLPIVLEKLQLRLHSNQYIRHKHVQLSGISEALLSEKLSGFEEALPDCIKLAYLPQIGCIRLRLTGYGMSLQALEKEMERQMLHLSNLVGNYIFSYEDKTLPELIADKLRQGKQTLGVAESCTGGYIAHLITSLPGSSNYFKGGVVAYSNEIKHKLLQVEQSILDTKGAVSKETVEQMLKNLLRIYDVDCGIAVSGIAGPGGGTPEKPVGTVWIAVANKETNYTDCFLFGNNRERVIRQTAMTALRMLYKLLS
jgi:nicotinamide-nucleotide amidase